MSSRSLGVADLGAHHFRPKSGKKFPFPAIPDLHLQISSPTSTFPSNQTSWFFPSQWSPCSRSEAAIDPWIPAISKHGVS